MNFQKPVVQITDKNLNKKDLDLTMLIEEPDVKQDDATDTNRTNYKKESTSNTNRNSSPPRTKEYLIQKCKTEKENKSPIRRSVLDCLNDEI